jgi:hypothetical protein
VPTTSWGFRYPAASAAPNVNQDIQNLANDVQTYVLPRFTSVAARNAAITSPVANQACIVGSVVHVFDGSKWSFTIYGEATYNTASTGIAQIAHGAGQAPVTFGGTLGPQSTEIKNQVCNLQTYFSDSTYINFRINRTDSLAVLGSDTVDIAWWAKF